MEAYRQTHTHTGERAHAPWKHTLTAKHAHKAHRYTRLHTLRLVLKNTYTCTDTHTNTHMCANCQERCLEREDPCHLLSHPASLFWLSNCQSHLSTTSHAEKQMSACHFSRHLTLKCSPFRSISEREEGGLSERERDPYLSLSLSGIQHLVHSSQLLVLSGKSQGQIAHIRHDYCNRLPPSSARWQFPSPALGFWLPKHASGSFYRHWLSADSRWN